MNPSTPEEDYNFLFKIVLVGDSGVGKTHLLNRYVKGSLPKNCVPTIGIEFATKTVVIEDKWKVKAQIWDTAGQERYRAISSAHYRRAVGALLVFDTTKEKTFENVSKWLEDLKYQAESDIVVMLVGNKIDLLEKEPSKRKVGKEEAMKFAQENKLLFEEASAFSSYNVTNVFEKLLKEICEMKNKKTISNSKTQAPIILNADDPTRPVTNKDKCC